MIIEERVRIQTKPGQPQPPRIGVNGPLPGLAVPGQPTQPGQPGLPGLPGAQTIIMGHLMPTTATFVSTSPLQPSPLAPQHPRVSHQTPHVQYVSTARHGPPPMMGTPQLVAHQHPSHPPNVPYVSTARYGPPSVMASSFLHDAVHGTSTTPMRGTIAVPPRIEENSLPSLTTEAPVTTVSTGTQPGGAGSTASATISPVQEMQDMEKQIRQLNKDFVNTYVKDTV